MERPLKEIVLEEYYEFFPLNSKLLAGGEPPHQPGSNHQVRLNDGETPTWGPLYSMASAELVVLKKWLEENMLKQFIRQS
jgi:hypothetical protein